MPDRRRALADGVADATPILLGIAPFGLVAGAAAVEAGFSPVLAVAMSVVVFAGAAQLAVVELVGQGGAPAVVVATAVVVNLRYLMYSAGIAPYFRRFSRGWRALSTYLLTDQAFALAVTRYASDDPVAGADGDLADRRYYYLGAAATLWAVWQATTVVGVVVGARVPPEWSLEFAVPLTFLALLVPAVEDRATAAAAGVGGGVAVAGVGLPLNLGLIAGAATGLLAGAVAGYLGDRGPADVTPVEGGSGHGEGGGDGSGDAGADPAGDDAAGDDPATPDDGGDRS